jgi:phosphoribosylformylglycinamidine synthase
VACTGARPAAATDGLNFGNPQLPHVYWQFERAVKGIADACEALQTPVVSGNVSFYNESEQGEVLPTPLIGMLGVLQDATRHVGMAVPKGGCSIGLLWPRLQVGPQQGLGASAYLAKVHGVEDGRPVPPDLKLERAVCDTLADWVEQGLVQAAHDVSEGGVAFALAEMCIAGGSGASIELPQEALGFTQRRDAALHAELPGFVLVCYQDSAEAALNGTLRQGLCFEHVGRSDGASDTLTVKFLGNTVVSLSVTEASAVYEGAIPGLMADR